MSVGDCMWLLTALLFTILSVRFVFRLGREAERQDQDMRRVLRDIDVDREAERSS